MNATMKKGNKKFSQARFDKFVAQHVRSMKRDRAKGHRDFKSFSDEQIQLAAESLAKMYNAGEYIEFVEL